MPDGLVFPDFGGPEPERPITEVERLRTEVERLRRDGSCRYAGPQRGDCEHYIGLPGHSIPGQHDGDDDTVDHYGKPNGWCWFCWHAHQREGLRRQLQEANEEVEQLRVQLAGCLTAAEGATNPEMSQIAEQGDYGWSPAYERTLQLHRDYDDLRRALASGDEPSEDRSEHPSRYEVIRNG